MKNPPISAKRRRHAKLTKTATTVFFFLGPSPLEAVSIILEGLVKCIDFIVLDMKFAHQHLLLDDWLGSRCFGRKEPAPILDSFLNDHYGLLDVSTCNMKHDKFLLTTQDFHVI